MKRISASSLSTALQIPSRTSQSTHKLSHFPQNYLKSQETAPSNQLITENPLTFTFLALCSLNFQQNKTYRKLQYHSLDKKEIDKQSKTVQDRKTMSLEDSFISFGKEKAPIQNRLDVNQKNQCGISDMIGSHHISKCNVFNETKNTGRSSVMVSTMNSIDRSYEKYQSSLNIKLLLSQDFKIPTIFSPVQATEHIQLQNVKSEAKNSPEETECVVKTRRLSTDDSIKLRENFETNQYQGSIGPLESASILCESIPVSHQAVSNLNAFEFDSLKDSLINKLNFFRKQESFIESKRKSFLRSNKKSLQQSPKFCNLEPVTWNQTQLNRENEQEFTDFERIDSKQTVEGKITRNKFKALKDCGKTIVSKYNKSSEQKSILQESNIVFQASKMCANQYQQNLKIPTFSDSQIVFDDEVKENWENDKPYSSFIFQNDSNDNHGLQMSNPNGNNISKKINRAFLRSKKSSSQKEIRSKENDEMEIRFDLDTFIEYGPL